MQGVEFATVVERLEMMAESQGRRRDVPTPHLHLGKVLRDRPVTELELVKLNSRWWMFYAAGLYGPDEAADVTVRRWRGEA